MQFYRLYAGADGQSHFEPLDSAKATFFNDTKPATSHLFRDNFAPQSGSFTLAVDGAQFITIASQGGFVLGEFTDCDDDYRHAHAAPILVTVEAAPLFTRFVRLPEFSSTQRIYEIKTSLSKLHAVLRI